MHPFVRSITALATLAVILGIAAPVLAKDDFEAQLDRAIPVTGEPGTTITVGFTVASTSAGAPLEGSPTFLRVQPLGGEPIETMARYDREGHYTATFEMPPNGIASVVIGLRGESCANGTCSRSDILFPVLGPEGQAVFVRPDVPPPANPGKVTAPAGPVATAAPVVPADDGSSASPSPVSGLPALPLLALGALVLAGGAALVMTTRRGARPTA